MENRYKEMKLLKAKIRLFFLRVPKEHSSSAQQTELDNLDLPHRG